MPRSIDAAVRRPTLKSAALWSGAATLTRLIVGFLSIKVTAVYLGPAGLALVGQLGNFVSLLQSTLGNAANSAVVKLAAESQEGDPARAATVIGTALRLVCAVGLLAGAAMLLLSGPLASWLLEDIKYSPIIVGLALAFPLVLLGSLAVALFTARRRFAMVSVAHIAATVVGTGIFVALCWTFGLWGGLAGIVVTYPVTFFVVQVMVRNDRRSNVLCYWSEARKEQLRPILRFYPMLLTHSVALPLSLLLVRDALISTFGAGQAGFWQASVRLSDMYTLVFIAVLSMYSLPTLSAANGRAEFPSILRQLVLVCLGMAAAGAVVLFLLRDVVVRIVFTPEFAPVTHLWPWQMLGDVFLIAGWPMRSALMARGRDKTYMAVEATIGVGFFLVTRALLGVVGLPAANLAHAIVWGSIFIGLLLLHRDVLFGASEVSAKGTK